MATQLSCDRPHSRVSMVSNQTYHSFNDIESHEPEVTSQQTTIVCHAPLSKTLSEDRPPPPIQEMRRQDSGYASIQRKESRSSCHLSSTLSAPSTSAKRRSRPAVQRSSTDTTPGTRSSRKAGKTVSHRRSYQCRPTQSQQPVTYFEFPVFTTSNPEYAIDEAEVNEDESAQTHVHPLPPQTTHYWTSDSTRRMEYAAIDAASRGVRGWFMRHIVPECVVPPSKRHVGFEDDRGSVVRYRLDLEEDDAEKTDDRSDRRRKSWWLSIFRR
ncbi:hypothetical protein NEUTE1DRAFT_124564 [Neurospora tetrasperma FGSC 2508]|uniref:Uncharacterized protein n=1 Tax=Neurospora tetrasperma (strain FGSC 2508 / ATCC MYA-4615 / P0657) TaxID=510951 RepID=F8MX11_NEUT8|nr:uncharacterized protein NEUTE1DRAFT_124564 [Neurospora tetrasperma FGSC 2508]EGO54282.1 hypothetical protein NEUTE1DRAFT_124564 [Neurospora tetrasperma FGSC 2508]EGZ68282.1 hypothetical protein NEUTE2DRAFT_118010 [Neurospora tetrasperma FGSC 2509]